MVHKAEDYKRWGKDETTVDSAFKASVLSLTNELIRLSE